MDINIIEERVFRDISLARRNYLLFKSFLIPLLEKSSLKSGDIIFKSILGCAIESCTLALCRLLYKNPDPDECTLQKYRNEVLKILPSLSDQDVSQQCIDNRNILKNSADLSLILNKEKDFWSKLEPIRHKILSHSDSKIEVKEMMTVFTFIKECVDHVESQHRILRSAHSDAGISGEYISNDFNSTAEKWINLLTHNNSLHLT